MNNFTNYLYAKQTQFPASFQNDYTNITTEITTAYNNGPQRINHARTMQNKPNQTQPVVSLPNLFRTTHLLCSEKYRVCNSRTIDYNNMAYQPFGKGLGADLQQQEAKQTKLNYPEFYLNFYDKN